MLLIKQLLQFMDIIKVQVLLAAEFVPCVLGQTMLLILTLA